MGHTPGRVMREIFEEVKGEREKRLTAAAQSGKPAEENEELLEWLRATDEMLTDLAKWSVRETIEEREKAAAAAAQ